MNFESRWEQLRLLTGKTARRLVESRTRIPDRPIRSGDVYVLRGSLVDWLALERDPTDPRRWRMLPVDDQSMMGSRDVAVDLGGQTARVRCGHEVWIDDDQLDSEVRTAHLSSNMVRRVRLKQSEVESGEILATVLQRETDHDPDYQNWLTTLTEVGQVLTAGDEKIETGPGAEVVRLSVFRSSISVRLLGLAASVLLVVSIGLELRLREALNQTSQVNVPFVWFQPGETGRGSEPLEVPAKARFLVLHFEVVDPILLYTNYRLRITDAWTDREIWRDDHFEPAHGSVLSAVLPCGIFESGDYQLRIYGLKNGEAKLMDEYSLSLKFF